MGLVVKDIISTVHKKQQTPTTTDPIWALFSTLLVDMRIPAS
jgi:hypothetical protein